jgi:hypothetical protein
MGNKLIKIFIVLGIVLSIPVSCIKEDTGSENCDMTYVTFSLRIEGETEALTRADETWGDDYPKSAYENDYDNYIDISSLQVLFFDNSTDPYLYAGKLEDLFYQSASGADYITFTGRAPSSLTPKSYKIVILANAETPNLNVGSFSLYNLKDMTTYTLYEDSAPQDIAIPMWGITTADLTLVKGAKQDIGTIYLLRSMARVIVYLDPNVYLAGDSVKFASRYDISSVSISNYNQSGYVLPSSFYEVSETTEITTDDDSFNEYETSATDLTVSGTSMMNRASGDSAIVYLPEITNADYGLVKISVTLTGNNIDGVSTDYPYENAISFLLDSAYCDIIRNHSYNFRIRNAYNGSLTAKLEVLPWDLEEETLDVGDSFVISDDGYLKFYTDSNGVSVSSDSLTYTFPQDSSYSVVLPFSFQIDGPTGAYWEANISNSKPLEPDFVFCDESGTMLGDGTVGDGASVFLPVSNVRRAGVIDGQRDTLYVKCTRTPGTSTYSATLEFYFYNPVTQTNYIIENMIDDSGAEKIVTFKLDPAS